MCREVHQQHTGRVQRHWAALASKWCHRQLSWGVSTPLHRAECFMRNCQVFC
jgi:hypothetical protein